MLSASSVCGGLSRRAAGVLVPAAEADSGSACENKVADALVMNVLKNKKPTGHHSWRGVRYNLGVESFLESWLSIQTRRGGRHRWVRTTTNAGHLDRSHFNAQDTRGLPKSQINFLAR